MHLLSFNMWNYSGLLSLTWCLLPIARKLNKYFVIFGSNCVVSELNFTTSYHYEVSKGPRIPFTYHSTFPTLNSKIPRNSLGEETRSPSLPEGGTAHLTDDILRWVCTKEIILHLERSWILEHFIWNNETHVINFLKNNFTFVFLWKDVHAK